MSISYPVPARATPQVQAPHRLQTDHMEDARIYHQAPGRQWKVMLTLCLVLAAACLVLLVLSPTWGIGLTLLGLLFQVSSWSGRLPGWVEVSSAGLRIRSQNVGMLRPRLVEWGDVRGVRRQRWTEVLMLELTSGKELPLPELTAQDRDALAADVTARLQPVVP